MRIFLSGGCKNGKSTWAQTLALAQRRPGAPLYYVATMVPVDGEDEERVARHRRERAGLGFETVELDRGLLWLTERCQPGGSVLLDSLTALLCNEMFPSTGPDLTAPARLARELETLLPQCPDLVLVSDYLYSDAAVYDPLVEGYRRGLARLDRTCSRLCHGVGEVVDGQLCCHKGGNLIRGLF